MRNFKLTGRVRWDRVFALSIVSILAITCLSTTLYPTSTLRMRRSAINHILDLIPRGLIQGSGVYYLHGDLVARLPWLLTIIDPNSTQAQAETSYFRDMSTVQVECLHRRRLGSMADGGWDVCLAGPYKPLTNMCLVYSFGINNDWSFDDAMADIFGCEVHSFDPTMKQTEYRRGSSVYFHPVGLFGTKTVLKRKKKGNKIDIPVDTLDNLVTKLRHERRVIDYLKFDIEGCEWSALPQMYSSGILDHVKQIGLESHTGFVHTSPAKYRKFMDKMNLLQAAGFRRWNSHLNEFNMFKSNVSRWYHSQCQETYYVNINYLDNKT